MLDEKDYKEIAHIMQVVIESDVLPKFDLLDDKIDTLSEKMVSKTRVEVLEDEVMFLKKIIRSMVSMRKPGRCGKSLTAACLPKPLRS